MSCSPGNTVDHQAARARQRDYMDLESATLAMIAEVFRRQQCRPTSLATTRIKRKPAPYPCHGLRTTPIPVASPTVHTSILAVGVVSPPQPDSRELDVIAKIRRGEGVSPYEYEGLLEQCGICKMYFTGTILLRHIFECTRPIL